MARHVAVKTVASATWYGQGLKYWATFRGECPDGDLYRFEYALGLVENPEAALVDQLFNSSEKRLASVLLLAKFGKEGKPEEVIPKMSQETLAEIIGTTRSRVSFFMNKFRKLGFIEYNGSLKIHSSLLNVILHD